MASVFSKTQNSYAYCRLSCVLLFSTVRENAGRRCVCVCLCVLCVCMCVFVCMYVWVCVCVYGRARASAQTHVPQPLGPVLFNPLERHFSLTRGLFIYCLKLWNSLLNVIKLWSRRGPNRTELSVSVQTISCTVSSVRHVRT